MGLQRRKRAIPVPNIVSMIDVIFFLVVFFMLFTNFDAPAEGIKVNLPSSTTAQPEMEDSFVVTITETGDMYFNREKINDRQTMIQMIEQAHLRNPSVLAIIQADESVPYQVVVSAIDMIRTAGIKNVSLAASLELEIER